MPAPEVTLARRLTGSLPSLQDGNPFYDMAPVVSLRSTTGYWLFSLPGKGTPGNCLKAGELPEEIMALFPDSRQACGDCRNNPEKDLTG